LNIEYKLNFNNIGEKRKYRLSKKNRLKIFNTSSWIENDLKNQWIYKDYNCYYIVISMFGKEEYKVSCSGANGGTYKSLNDAQVAAISFCDKLLK